MKRTNVRDMNVPHHSPFSEIGEIPTEIVIEKNPEILYNGEINRDDDPADYVRHVKAVRVA